ncbi:hypothetical protein [Streptomyces sp. NBC_01276]|uniref:hypothetical protein n=1 Tax=Streptomyces sp. NBC_01276 TaxID=2903808 RepID=UPI002F912259
MDEFTCTQLYLTALENPGGCTLDRLLQLPNQDMVDDVVHQLYLATTGPLEALRAAPRPRTAPAGPPSRAQASPSTPTSWSTACGSTSRPPSTPSPS